MKVYIVSIGNELLEGSVVDTNSSYIAQRFITNGIETDGILICPDDKERLKKTLEGLMQSSSCIITTGGLGPTFDDITTETVAELCGRKSKLNRKLYFELIEKVKAKGIKPTVSHLKQLYLPEGSTPIKNQYGTAPGFYIKFKESYIICLPGVPSEMKPMFDNHVINIVKDIVNPEELHRADLKIIGVAESEANRFLKTLNSDRVQVILNAMEGELAVRLRAKDKKTLLNIERAFMERYEFKVYSTKDEKIEDVLANLLDELNLTISFKESITAGILAQLMIDKACFKESLISSSESDIERVSDADILACPCNLTGNEFELKLRVESELKSFNLRYLGNVNFMRKSVAKRTLGFIFEYLKKHYD